MDESGIESAQAPESAVTESPKNSRRKVYIVIGAAVAVALAAVSATLVINARNAQAEADRLEDHRVYQFTRAANGCGIDPLTREQLDNGDAFNLPRATKYDGATVDQVHCFLDELDAPESLKTKLGQTRALDGTQSAAWAEFEATWTYHPDSGLNLLVERVGEPVLPEN